MVTENSIPKNVYKTKNKYKMIRKSTFENNINLFTRVIYDMTKICLKINYYKILTCFLALTEWDCVRELRFSFGYKYERLSQQFY